MSYGRYNQPQLPFSTDPWNLPPNSQIMSGQNQSYPQAGYPQPNFQNQGGYPNQSVQPNQRGYPNQSVQPNQGGYPNQSGQPNQGGYPTPTAGAPPPSIVPNVCPSAPDLSQIEKIPGYENITFKEEILVPPSLPIWQPPQEERRQLENLPGISEEEVRDAVTEYASEHCCYGSGVARDMQIKDVIMNSSFHYILETFTEKRESAWRFEPYTNQSIDGPMNGPAPAPWDIYMTPPNNFQNAKAKTEVPHTAFVKPCHTCVGNGRVRCDSCTGNGRKQCTWCNGRGWKTVFDKNEMCSSCSGSGYDRCFSCSGTGQIKCKTCNGKCNLKAFVELIVTWTNHVDDYISETANMPKDLIRDVTGQVVFEEENPRVGPINHAADNLVNQASNQLVTKHNGAFPNERILKQRHRLRIVPIAQTKYKWKNNDGEFYVYGFEKKVYFADYPQKCFCCIIL